MKPNQRFLLKYFAILIVVFLVISSEPVERYVIVPFTSFLALVSGKILAGMGEPVSVSGTYIKGPAFSVEILNGCNGVEAILILVASIFAFPASFSSRMAGVIVGSAALQVLNIVRLVSLFLLGTHHKKVFDLFHSAVWQVLIILASLGIFLLWRIRFASQRSTAGVA